MCNSEGRLVKHFSLEEMANNRAIEKVKLVITPELVTFAQMIQELRFWYGKPMNVTSWYRTKSFNSLCGGSPNSAHLDGRAVDIIIQECDYYELTEAWENICLEHNCIGGVNYYYNRMHFTNYENKFGHKSFVVRDKRR